MIVENQQRLRIALVYGGFAAFLLFGLGSLTIFPVAGAGLIAAIDRSRSAEIDDVSVERIYHLSDWNAATSLGQAVLFVDCDWGIEVVAYRRFFVEFARSLPEEGNVRAFTVKLDYHDQDELWEAIENLWSSNDISPGGMQTMNGAGRIVWLKEGGVVDYCWAWEEEAPANFSARTIRAFSQAKR